MKASIWIQLPGMLSVNSSTNRRKINSVFAGHDVSAAVSMAGKVWVWGAGFFWQLGQEDNKDRLVPTTLGNHSAPQPLLLSLLHISQLLETAQPQSGSLVFWGTEEGANATRQT